MFCVGFMRCKKDFYFSTHRWQIQTRTRHSSGWKTARRWAASSMTSHLGSAHSPSRRYQTPLYFQSTCVCLCFGVSRLNKGWVKVFGCFPESSIIHQRTYEWERVSPQVTEKDAGSFRCEVSDGRGEDVSTLELLGDGETSFPVCSCVLFQFSINNRSEAVNIFFLRVSFWVCSI